MFKLIRTLNVFYKKTINLAFIIQFFNFSFAGGLLALYLSYYPFDAVTDYTPTNWDYMYFTWEKAILFLFFVCMYPLCKIKRIKIQFVVLGVFSFLRLVWQLIEWHYGSFGTENFIFFVLSVLCFGAIMFMIIPPMIVFLFKKAEKRIMRKAENEIKNQTDTKLDMIIY